MSKSKRKKILLYSLLGLLLLLAGVLWWQHALVSYGLMQAEGQLRILREARPLEEVLADKNVPDSLKKKILLIQDIRDYAVDSLGLRPSDSYTTLFDQKGEEVLWVVSAVRPYKMEAKEWWFPFVGTVSYKGYFDYDKVIAEQRELDSLGYDTYVRPVGAWSTLGWFNDPIMSNLLFRGDGSLANTIIHELTHATVFVPDSLTFNENLASFIGHQGALRFLDSGRQGLDEDLETYRWRSKGRELLSAHLLKGYAYLDSLYQQMPEELPEQEKERQKQKAIERIVLRVDTLPIAKPEQLQAYLREQSLNNAYFYSYQRYRSEQEILQQMLDNQFDGDIERFIAYFRKRYGR